MTASSPTPWPSTPSSPPSPPSRRGRRAERIPNGAPAPRDAADFLTLLDELAARGRAIRQQSVAEGAPWPTPEERAAAARLETVDDAAAGGGA
jgi:hypothetical protein